MSLLISDDGIRSELVSTSRPARPNGKSKTASNYHPGDTPAIERPLAQLCDTWDSAPEDFLHIGEKGLIGKPSPVAAIRIGRLALNLGKACAWTLADCVVVMRGAGKAGENDKSALSNEVIGAKLGISADRVAKYARMANAFPMDERLAGVDFTLHEEVAGLTQGARETILQQAQAEQLTCAAVRELVKAVKPAAARSNKGRPTREPRLPVAPTTNTQPTSVNGIQTVAPVAPVDTLAPAGVSHVPPSLSPTGIAPKLILNDRDACSLVWEKAGRDLQAAESLLAEIVRAHFAKGV